MSKRTESKIESKILLNGKLSELFHAYSELDTEAVEKSIDALEKENLLLFEIAKTALLYIRTQEIIETEVSTGGGSPVSDVLKLAIPSAINS